MFLGKKNIVYTINISEGNYVLNIVIIHVLTYPFSENGSSRYGNRTTIPSVYITLTLSGGDVLKNEYNKNDKTIDNPNTNKY